MGFTSLAYFIDIPWLQEAYRRTRKEAAVGVDGQTPQAYAVNLQANLQALLDRAKSGTYRAPPVGRAYIPKDTGSETRPLGIPTFEDKILQRAVVMALEPIYEQDLDVLPKRFGKYGLALHPTKTRLVPFRRPQRRRTPGPTTPPAQGEKPGTFVFLGFCHYWGWSWKGFWVVKQQRGLNQKLQGHYSYYGITGNYGKLQCFWYGETAAWRKWLGRRGQASGLTWETFVLLLQAYPLSLPRVVHSVYRA